MAATVPGAGAGSLAFVACFHSEGAAPENAAGAVTAVLDAKFTLYTVRPASAWKNDVVTVIVLGGIYFSPKPATTRRMGCHLPIPANFSP